MIVSRRRDTLWNQKILNFKKTKKIFWPKKDLKGNLVCIHMELQGSKESTSARYFFLCLKLAQQEVSRLRDSITHT